MAIDNGATDNTIGGTTAGAGNVITGSTYNGLEIWGSGTSGNVAEGNDIGTNPTGATARDSGGNSLGNYNGVGIDAGATDNTIGGTTAGALNVISGNSHSGLDIWGSGTSGNVAEGNYIGTDATGTTDYDNAGNSLGNIDGVSIDSGAIDNTIGGTTAAARNVIDASVYDGVQLSDDGTTGNLVEGNYIGTSVTGDTALPNDRNGVTIQYGATGNTVGGMTAGAANVVSGNDNDGIWITLSAASNTVEGNDIGTDSTARSSWATVPLELRSIPVMTTTRSAGRRQVRGTSSPITEGRA